ncbi:MAG: hypothetical protein M5U22_07120 [Thermoleophilia bacterium]|nr:hypothetical protein [Thermoleophilia bacterium]
MQSYAIEVAHKYGMREKVSPGEPLIQVQVLEKAGKRGQVKVRRLSEPNAGLEDWVKTRQLIVPWAERQAFLKDEEREGKFDEARPKPNQALSGAIETVMYATGYDDAGADDDGTVHMDAAELREIARLSGLPQKLEDLHPLAYVDRHGDLHLPLEVAEQLAHAYASAESESVLMYIEDQEKEYKYRGNEPGERFWHDELRRRMPGFALARYWAGHEEEIAYLRAEIERLRGLVVSAADTLSSKGLWAEAGHIRLALQGR